MTAKITAKDEMRMKSDDFDRIMEQALRVKAEDAKKLKVSGKKKKADKKKASK